jgi:hypothetical protein
MQLNVESFDDIIVEWISYDHFNNIKEIRKDDFASVYLAIWKDGLVKYNYNERKYERTPNKEVTLKCMNNSHNTINDFSNEV